MGQVKAAFTERMQEQVNLLTAITNTQSQHASDLISLQQKDKANQETFTDVQQRLTKPETAPSPPPRANSSTTAEERQPALILGGRADDQDAAITQQLAKDATASLQSDIDMQDAFVPGVRRGYLVVPYTARQQESEGNTYTLPKPYRKFDKPTKPPAQSIQMAKSSTYG